LSSGVRTDWHNVLTRIDALLKRFSWLFLYVLIFKKGELKKTDYQLLTNAIFWKTKTAVNTQQNA